MDAIYFLIIVALVAGAVMVFALHRLGAVHRQECLLKKDAGRR